MLIHLNGKAEDVTTSNQNTSVIFSVLFLERSENE